MDESHSNDANATGRDEEARSNDFFDQFLIELDEVASDNEFAALKKYETVLKEQVRHRSWKKISEDARGARESARKAIAYRTLEADNATRVLQQAKGRAVAFSVVLAGSILALTSSAFRAWITPGLATWLYVAIELLALGVAVSFLVLYLRARAALTVSNRMLQETMRLNEIVFNDVLHSSISAAYSVAISELLAKRGLVNFPRSAPRLVELDLDVVVPLGSIGRVTGFIKDHATSAIGITGPRGVGKSTLLSEVCKRVREAGGNAILIPSPVEHNPIDLLRTIAVSLQDETMANVQDELNARAFGKARRRYQLASLGALALAYLALIVMGFGFLPSADDFFAYTEPNVGFLTIGLLLLATSIFSLFRIRRIRPRRAGLISNSSESILNEVIDSLSFEIAAGSTTSLSVAGGPFEASGGRSRNKTTREVTHAQLSQALRDALRTKGNQSDAPFLLAIDELDKLPTREALLATVNALKDLLHIRNVHVAMTLSDEALGSFELRQSAERDAFDSTFDILIDVDRLEAPDAVAVIDSRVTGFPLELSLLCFVWAGGLPRDLLRHARTCVEHAKEVSDVASWSQVGFAVAHAEAVRKLNAAVRGGSSLKTRRAIEALVLIWAKRPPIPGDLAHLEPLDEGAQKLGSYLALCYAATWVLTQIDPEGSDVAFILGTLRDGIVATNTTESAEAAVATLKDLNDYGLLGEASKGA